MLLIQGCQKKGSDPIFADEVKVNCCLSNYFILPSLKLPPLILSMTHIICATFILKYKL